MKSFFTEVQWQWVADRHREGYTLGDLALFLGIHRDSVRRGLIRLGAIPENRRELPPLRPRRAEFIRLNRRRGAPGEQEWFGEQEPCREQAAKQFEEPAADEEQRKQKGRQLP